jgi:predicted RNA-binding protein with TRAM domain
MARFERRGFGGRGGFGGGSGRRFDDRSDMPKPVNVGEEYDVEISEVGSRGDGIARVKNFVVFVAGAKQGEKVKIKIKEVMSRFAIGERVGASEAAEAATEAKVATEAGAATEAEEPAEAVEETEEAAPEAEEETVEETEEV